MPIVSPRDSTIAIVGDGFGSLIVYATAVYLGFRPQEITIYGPSDNPVKTYQQFDVTRVVPATGFNKSALSGRSPAASRRDSLCSCPWRARPRERSAAFAGKNSSPSSRHLPLQ